MNGNNKVGKALSLLTLVVAGSAGTAMAHEAPVTASHAASALEQATDVQFAQATQGIESDFLAIRSDDDTLVEHHHHDVVNPSSFIQGSTFNV
ncbi:MAG TPA: hypothetical protein VM621_14610 [Luteibacter sp.]|jgi:hypothetical protein|uniref:hypothetical protein n=1 Tax=Luteibacter sp. TaxID=1886636 RepID=UPI002C20864E|nr:hypothetical protein [Luteibacter sp.]HVI56272.1 hypothetical protein [Luteibacter sp.]